VLFTSEKRECGHSEPVSSSSICASLDGVVDHCRANHRQSQPATFALDTLWHIRESCWFGETPIDHKQAGPSGQSVSGYRCVIHLSAANHVIQVGKMPRVRSRRYLLLGCVRKRSRSQPCLDAAQKYYLQGRHTPKVDAYQISVSALMGRTS
jgi:hypothetical protein